MDEAGYIKTFLEHQKQILKVYLLPVMCRIKYMQAVTAAGSGCMAALDAERYLSALESQ